MRAWGPALCKAMVIVIAAGQLGACTSIFPSFGGPGAFGYFNQNLPARDVAIILQCELRDYLRNAPPSVLELDPAQAAQVTLNLQTDHAGAVTYVGIDLKKFGLSSLAEFISVKSNVPTLAAQIKIKSTVSAQIDMSIPQTINRGETGIDYVPDTANPPEYVQVAPGKFQLVHPQLYTEHKKELKRVIPEDIPCPTGLEGFVKSLYLREWLDNFFSKTANEAADLQALCMSKLTLKTSFNILVDISGGVNPFLHNPILVLPINSLTGDYSPALTHTLQIALALKDKNKKNFCPKPPPGIPVGPHTLI